MTDHHTLRLSPAICKHIDQWIERYPPEQKRSGVFEALRLVQEENGGSLTVPLMDAVADYLMMPKKLLTVSNNMPKTTYSNIPNALILKQSKSS